ncbi:hypothetical protein Tco_1449613 [Tanacetum coccineum]
MHFFALTVSETKPKNIKEAMTNHAWIEAMQEEHHQFDRVDVWELVEVVVENKKDKESTFIHNKAHLVAKGYQSPPLIILRNPDPTTPSTQGHVEEDNNIQADDVVFDAFEFINPFATLVTELATNPEMRFCALIVSETEPKNIKEAMTDHAWIEAIKELSHHRQIRAVTDWYQSQGYRELEYVPDLMEREDHVPVYILEPEQPEDLVPAEDEAPIEAYITEVASAPPSPPSFLPSLI